MLCFLTKIVRLAELGVMELLRQRLPNFTAPTIPQTLQLDLLYMENSNRAAPPTTTSLYQLLPYFPPPVAEGAALLLAIFLPL